MRACTLQAAASGAGVVHHHQPCCRLDWACQDGREHR